MKIYKLKYYYAVPHSGVVYDKGRIFICESDEYHVNNKCWCLATPDKPAIGSTLYFLVKDLLKLDYLEETTLEENEWVLPHINKEVKVLFYKDELNKYKEHLDNNYKSLKKTEKNITSFSNSLLDIIEQYYAVYLKNKKIDLDFELDKFIKYFLQDKFDRQIHLNIWTAFAFWKDTKISKNIILFLREKYS